jgi:hypothetical protein
MCGVVLLLEQLVQAWMKEYQGEIQGMAFSAKLHCDSVFSLVGSVGRCKLYFAQTNE